MDGTNFTDVMVDTETTGLQPHAAAIIQIGAVPFNYQTMQIDFASRFKRSLTMPNTRYWTDGTQKFWMVDNPEVYQTIMSEAQPFAQVMKEFHAWVNARPEMTFWCKGLNFDWNFIESYFRSLDMVMPFNFRNAKDLRSFISGRYDRSDSYEPEYERIGKTHDALDDCFSQLNLLSKVKEETCQSTSN